MITAIVLIVLAVCGGIYWGRKGVLERRMRGYTASMTGSIVGAVSFALFMAGIVGGLGSLPVAMMSGDTTLAADYRIYSLRHFDTTSGTFFLGCGSIGGRRQYAVFRETSRGMCQAFYNTYDTYIQEGDIHEPYAEYYRVDTKHWARMAFPLAWLCRSSFRPERKDYFVLHVPTGTVTQEFTLE